MSTSEDVLFLLLRKGLFLDSLTPSGLTPNPSPEGEGGFNIDWKEVIDLSFEQGVAAIAVDGLQHLVQSDAPSKSPPVGETFSNMEGAVEDMKFEWLGETLNCEAENAEQRQVVLQLAKQWADGGISMMWMKGQAVGTYYPIPEHRPVGDVDVFLVHSSEGRAHSSECIVHSAYELGNEIAERVGALVDTHWYKHSQIHYKGQMFENHQYFVTTREGKQSKELNRILYEILEEQELKTLGDSPILLPPPMFNALFLTYHGFSHFLSEGMHLKQVVDWAMFLQAEQHHVDWKRMYEICDRFHFTRFLNAMNDIAVHKLGVEVNAPGVVCESPYTEKILHSIFYDKDYVFGSGKSGWQNRWHLITNLFKYQWKYHQLYQESILKQLWYYATGFVFKTE